MTQRLAPRRYWSPCISFHYLHTYTDSYIHSLEERIASLEIKLRDHGIDCDGDNLGHSVNNSGSCPELEIRRPRNNKHAHSLRRPHEVIETITAKSVQVTVESLSDNLHIGSSNGISFTRLFLSELQWEDADVQTENDLSLSGPEKQRTEYITFEAPNAFNSNPVPLPNKKAAEYLTTIYFELANFSLPILHEPTFRKHLANAYAPGEVRQSREIRNELFCFLVFAIALSALQKTDSSSVSTPMCESYHQSALKCLEEVGLRVDIESVQVLLLFANYSYLHPSLAGTWKLVGMAVRLAIEQGLHKEPSQGHFNPLELDTRRRVFWVAYSFDRNIGTYLGRPFSFADGAITTEVRPYPSLGSRVVY